MKNKKFIKWYYEKYKKFYTYVKKVVIGGFIALIVIIGSSKYTELTVTGKYEKYILRIQTQTENLLLQHGLEWKETEIVIIENLK
jgi:hypothetical protein